MCASKRERQRESERERERERVSESRGGGGELMAQLVSERVGSNLSRPNCQHKQTKCYCFKEGYHCDNPAQRDHMRVSIDLGPCSISDVSIQSIFHIVDRCLHVVPGNCSLICPAQERERE